ncbi:molecular chaperone DnaJ [Escherichia coli]|nr:molecular chaperone DnaJ [Escherichia coli]EFE5014809.1 molecular chaperone DnaJ [Escherichia coli]EFE7607185.1 molecular chaperone DnaJ [Escherichia coli]EFH2950890.1 molecular chaperone DnaJ [Escherichia coli]EFO0011575.1 molecular chaperone DnaJ [Escherichia coli]
MSTITREWLQQAINDYESVRDELPFGLDDYQGNILAALRIALASLEAEPVAWKVTFTQIDREYNTFTGMYSDKAEVERWVRLHKACDFRADITPLYTAKPVPVTPDGWVIVPKKLTAENGAKGVLSGEFSETTFISCPECFGDDDCDTCDGSGRIEIKVPVTWTTIKSIWDKGIEYFAAKPSQEVK